MILRISAILFLVTAIYFSVTGIRDDDYLKSHQPLAEFSWKSVLEYIEDDWRVYRQEHPFIPLPLNADFEYPEYYDFWLGVDVTTTDDPTISNEHADLIVKYYEDRHEKGYMP